MTEKILLGFEVETGKEVYMKLHHTVITGMTQLSGKTTALEALISRSGLRAIAFRTKRGEAGFSSYREIQPFFIEQSDWRYVSSLLEAMLRERMKFERSWIIKATKGTKTLCEVYENVKSLREKARKDSLTESVYITLEEYLAGIIPQIEKFNFVRELNLSNGINVMDLSEMSLEMRSLVIRSVMGHVIDGMSHIVVVVPEAWEYLPQGRTTPVKLYAETFIRKGASIGNYLFVDSQDIAGIDKTPLRSCDNWIMGRQKETHEVERFREVVGKNVSEEEIKSLLIGHFIAYLGDEIKKVYVLPANVPEEVGRKVALGELTPEYVHDNYLEKKESDEEMVWKEKYEELAKSVESIRERAFAEGVDSISGDLVEDNKFLSDKKVKLEKELADADATIEKLQHTDEEIQAVQKLKDALQYLFPTLPPRLESQSQGNLNVALTDAKTVFHVEEDMKHVEASTENAEGKILWLAKDGFLDDWKSQAEIEVKLAEQGWTLPRITLYKALSELEKDGVLGKKGKPNKYKLARGISVEV